MTLKEILKKLEKTLDDGDKLSSGRRKRLDKLLDKLESRKHKLSKKLADEKDGGKRKKLKLELKIVAIELKKAMSRRKELLGKRK